MDVCAEICEIVCRVCGETFAEWEHRTPDSLVCPRCGHDLRTDPAYLEDGSWSADPGEEREER